VLPHEAAKGVMTFAKFDPRTIISETLRDLRIPIVAFANLQHESHVSRWQIERALRGERQFDHFEARDLTNLAKELRALQDSFEFPIDWRDVNQIRGILRRRREQEAPPNRKNLLQSKGAAVGAESRQQ
jgi:hypothetical protein